MKHINYFDLGLWKNADELGYMIESVLPEFDDISYAAYGIEAHPMYANSVKEKYINNKNVFIYNLAISDSIGKTNLFLANNDGLGNSIFATKNNVDVNNVIVVNTTTFSNFLSENKIDLTNSINILKVNIEGAELFLWEDLKKNNLRNSFHIICGHHLYDIYKLSELKNKLDYYNHLTKEQNINFMFFCQSKPTESIKNMKSEIVKILK